MARCWWGAEKPQMEVEPSGSGTASENTGETTVCYKPELCKGGCTSGGRAEGGGREAQVQTLDLNFLKVKLKGVLLPVSSQAKRFFLPCQRSQFHAYQPRSIPRKIMNAMM